MKTLHMSKNDLKKMFVEVSVQSLLAESLPNAIEKAIPNIPKEQQDKVHKNLEKFKKNPNKLFAKYSKNRKTSVEVKNSNSDRTTIDRDSESYKKFSIMCESLMDYFDANEEEVKNTYKHIYAEIGIELIVI